MNVRRTKPYVCVDCDYAEHFRFQETKDLEAAAGTWLRCLVHSRAQEQDGIVKLSWLRRTFAGKKFTRVDELVRVGLLRKRDDGDYEIHAYAPRNQTKAVINEERAGTRERMTALRHRGRNAESVTAHNLVTNANVTGEESPRRKSVTDANVPTSTSISTSLFLDPVPDLDPVTEIQRSQEGGVQRGEVRSGNVLAPDAEQAPIAPPLGERRELRPLPASERALSGPAWIAAFTDGISEVTGRPCTAGKMYTGTLERIVAHHAPERAAPQACAWIKEQAKAFARKWDGKHPPKGLTPDGLERWLNEGRQGPPEFGRPRIVQLPAEEWHEDDWSDLGVTVLK
jgi:hypothetical protein